MTTVADWSPGANVMPDVRVGVVLPSDGARQLRLTVPDAGYTLTGESGPATMVRAQQVDFEIADGGVRAVGGGTRGTTACWTLHPPGRCGGPDQPTVVFHGLVVGRGFHWQDTMSHRLPGAITIRRSGGWLLVVCRLPVEDYLAGVISSEMSGDCPIEFLKAQCVVARSWTLAAAERKHAELDLDLCNDDCCQRFHGYDGVTGPVQSAVAQTHGLVLTAEGAAVVDANYSKCCGGIVEAPAHVWGVRKPGLTSLVDAPRSSALHGLVPLDDARVRAFVAGDGVGVNEAFCSPANVNDQLLNRYLGRVDRGGGFFRWNICFQRAELEEVLRAKGHGPPEPGGLCDLVVTRRGASGRATSLDLIYETAGKRRSVVVIDGQHSIRQALHPKFLYSSAFCVTRLCAADGHPTGFRLDGAGWGHGAGLCQIGALGMALSGSEHTAILSHYFPTAGLVKAYP